MRQVLAPVSALQEIEVPVRGSGMSFSIEDSGPVFNLSALPDPLPVGPTALESALRMVPGLSKTAVAQWPVDLLNHPLNWWFQHGDGQVKIMLPTDGTEVLAFTRAGKVGINPSHVLDVAVESLGSVGVDPESLVFDKVRVGLDSTCFAAIAAAGQGARALKVGDVTQAGVMFFTTPTGQKATEITPFLYRLVCTNGMISAAEMGRFAIRGGDGESIGDWTRRLTLQAWDAVDGELDAMASLVDIPINEGNSGQVLSDLYERHHVSPGLRREITEALAEEADGSMYGVAQAFSRAANDLEDPHALRHLLMVTGDVAHQRDRCTACQRVLN